MANKDYFYQERDIIARQATVELYTPQEVAWQIAKLVKVQRLALDLSQNGLAIRSGVSLSSIKVFEQTGKISLESLLKIALILDSLAEFLLLFRNTSREVPHSLDDILKCTTRRRGRK